jgi:hypothetical protein
VVDATVYGLYSKTDSPLCHHQIDLQVFPKVTMKRHKTPQGFEQIITRLLDFGWCVKQPVLVVVAAG